MVPAPRDRAQRQRPLRVARPARPPRQPVVPRQRLHNWCFTLNNYTDADVQRLQTLDCRFIIFGKEVCPTTGTPHLQGYVQWSKSLDRSTTRTRLGEVHLTPADGDSAHNITYCSKVDKNAFRRGAPVDQGQRSSISLFLAQASTNHSHMVIARDHPADFARYHSAFDKLRLSAMPKRNWQMEVFWFYGPTGTGKSHKAHVEAGDDCYRKPPGPWWDGYTGQHTVILDEFRPDWFPFYKLLLLLDKYPMVLEIKGSFVQFCSRRIYITSPSHFRDMYASQTEEKLDQLKRRITHVEHFPFAYHAPDSVIVEDVENVENNNLVEEKDDDDYFF